MITFYVMVALILDRLFGEPRRAHPLVFFGALASRLEARLRSIHRLDRPWKLRLAGACAWMLLVIAPTAGLNLLGQSLGGAAQAVLGVVVLYACIGYRSLEEHCRAVAVPLLAGDTPAARGALAMIVSRDTDTLEAPDIARGTVESLLENGSDAVVGPVFWYFVAGAPGALCYRLANTLDAMWGYRNDTYRNFGWCAARLDDLLNLFPARLCALAYAAAGSFADAMGCWWRQARQHDSPNAGPVIAAGAGALGVRLGGAATYGGQERWRPLFGCGRDPQPCDIERGISLLFRAFCILLLLCLGAELLL